MESITLKIPRLGNPSVSDTWSLAKIVRKVEFKLLQLIIVVLPALPAGTALCPWYYLLSGILLGVPETSATRHLLAASRIE
jgi:hypothetical protein